MPFVMKMILLAHPSSFATLSMPRFARMIFHGMKQRGHDVKLWSSKPILGRLPVHSSFLRKWLGYGDQFVIYPRELRRQVALEPRDTLFVVTDQALGMWVPHIAHRPHAIHCHDFMALKSALGEYPENPTGWCGRQYQQFIRKGFSRGEVFISVSKKTNEDLQRFMPKQPTISEVVHNGLNHPFHPMSAAETTTLLNEHGMTVPDSGFILHIGGNQWYKNRTGVLEIYREYVAFQPRPAALWMIGATPTEKLLSLAATIPAPGQVRFFSGWSNEQVNAAYSRAHVLLFPSLEEGFGWPILEAMASGCVVITTDTAPLNEVAGRAAFLIPRMPANAPARKLWAQSAAKVLDKAICMDGHRRAELLSQGQMDATHFDTEAVLTAYEAIYLRALNGTTCPPR